ncbi:hypothetical protein M5D96_001549 [Drosophila gunungcola]|uniref:Uncharacterized protein n=1 Tax=Drosophila gunungcola TaxID=103775 RepID=A0A9P9YYC3_9MUSC|nr:hypothetical protein M5D96_001549 [Drosophila gunungcola]
MTLWAHSCCKGSPELKLAQVEARSRSRSWSQQATVEQAMAIKQCQKAFSRQMNVTRRPKDELNYMRINELVE